ncbi:hypothetical protein [Streptomyces sp. NPDC091219]|uniref:hypothetical protein n=1 Tax=Streptomyces sp. NPDC091219 TaxID=3155193 RepID=UPI00344EBB48
MQHLRGTVWGPAEFVGLPPRWLVAEGILVAILGVVAIIGTSLFGAWTGRPSLADGEGGLVCAAAVGLYLSLVRAGRALVGVAVLLGACLALQAPQAAAGLVLAERGQTRSVVVMSVEEGRTSDGGHVLHLCSVRDPDGVPLEARIWRGCGRATRPGDALTVVYDPRGAVPPRGAEPDAGIPGAARDLAPWAAVLGGVTLVAVVRSYRLTRLTLAVPGPTDGAATR